MRDGKSMKEYRAFAARFVLVVINIFRKFYHRFEIERMEYFNDLKLFVDENENSNEDYSETYVLGLLKLLFFQETIFSSLKNRCVVYISTVLVCKNRNGAFAKVSEISRRVAKLLYCMKVTTFAILKNELEELDINNVLQIRRIEQYYLGFFNSNTNNPIITIFRLSKFVSSFGIGEKLPEVYWVLDSNFTCLQAGPTTVSVEDMREGAKNGLSILKSFFTEKLLMNFHWDVPNVLSDDFIDTRDGFYFVNDKGNNFRPIQDNFHYHLINCGLTNNIEGYISHWRKFIQLLIFNIHLTSGNPARATELETIQFRNTLGVERNVFVSQDKVALIPSYNKTNNVKGQDRLIPRFLPKELSHIVIKYLVLVQPILEYYYEKISNTSIAGPNQSCYLFSCHQKHLDSIQIKDDFMKVFRQIFEKEVKFSIFRHIVDAFGLKHISKYESSFESYENFSIQAGHSSLTASKNYGAMSNDFKNVDRESLAKFYQTSSNWHRFLKLEDTDHNLVERFEKMMIDSAPSVNITETLSKVEEQRIANSTIERSRVFGRNVVISNFELNGNNDFQKLNTLSDSIKIVQSMRKMLKDDSVSFSCEEQALTACEVMKRENDILAVIPTGFGKTMTIFTSAKNEGLVTVFIYPLVGIKNMMLKKCREFRIECEDYVQDKIIGQPNIILVSIKNATSESFMTVLGRLSSMKLLARIVIDEVHLCIQWSNFRTEYEKIIFYFILNLNFYFYLGLMICTYFVVSGYHLFFYPLLCPKNMKTTLKYCFVGT